MRGTNLVFLPLANLSSSKKYIHINKDVYIHYTLLNIEFRVTVLGISKLNSIANPSIILAGSLRDVWVKIEKSI